jgi:hypothetical protein
MSSIIRSIKESNPIRNQYAVHAYRGLTGENDYYFTVRDDKLYRIENDLSGCHWIPARDMGTQRVITDIDPEIIEGWENANGWSNIKVIRPGTARKFQALAMPVGNLDYVSPQTEATPPSFNDGPAWNAGAYLPYDYKTSTPVYDAETNPVNGLLTIGNANTTVSNNYTENLPYATFWAVNDPVVIEYQYSFATYRRAIKNRIDATTI